MVDLDIQALLIRDAVILVKPQRVKELLNEIDLEKEGDALKQQLIVNHVFHYASIMSIILKDSGGQWLEPKIIQKRRSDIKWIMAIFEDYLDVIICEGIPRCMITYDYVFKATDDETDDEVLEIPKSELLAKGFREIDIELQVAALRLDYEKAEDLLEKGADPEVYFGGSTTAADFVHTEIEHLTEELYPFISGQQEHLQSSDAMQIVALGAHEKMWQLFVKYKRINSTKRTSGQNYFLMDLCSVYQRYVDGVPDEFDEIDFTFDFPIVGWIDMHLYKNGQTVNFVELSYVYEPFENMKDWIESVALGTKTGMTSNLCIETEGPKQVFSFQPIWTCPYGKSNGKSVYHGDTGIFTIYDEAENRIIFEAYCETRQLVEKFYGALLNYAKSMSEKKEFVDAWISTAYNHEMSEYEDDSPELQQLFLKKIQSPILDAWVKELRL